MTVRNRRVPMHIMIWILNRSLLWKFRNS